MLNLGFTNNYDIVHLTSEIGKDIIGGICTFLNEHYDKNRDNTKVGFIQVAEVGKDRIQPALYEGMDKNLLIVGKDEVEALNYLNCKTLVIHFYVLLYFLPETIFKDKNIVYVLHSIPTTEPWNFKDPFNDASVQKTFERLCGMATKLICVSKAEKRKLTQLYPQLKDKIDVIYNGINMNTNLYNDNYKRQRKNFGYIGRFDIRKGVYDTLKDITKYDAKFKISSGFADPKEMKKIIQYLNITKEYDKVDFLGWCGGVRKEEFFKSIDVLIIPSLYEPFGYTALEAMQYGVPIISSGNGGLKEILGEDYRYLYNPYLEGDFDRVMKLFLNDSNEIIEQQVNNLKERLNLFTTDIMVENYNKILNEL